MIDSLKCDMNNYLVTWDNKENPLWIPRGEIIQARSKGQAYRIAVQKFNAIQPRVEGI